MTAGLQGERGGQVQSDVGEGALQGGHAVSVGQRPALHDGHVVGATDGQLCTCFIQMFGRRGCFSMGQPFSPPGVYFKVII